MVTTRALCIAIVFGSVLSAQVSIDNDDIGGVVTSSKGTEAGVWVIAETTDLPTKFAKIVVTDDRGRYLIPDLPSALIWVPKPLARLPTSDRQIHLSDLPTTRAGGLTDAGAFPITHPTQIRPDLGSIFATWSASSLNGVRFSRTIFHWRVRGS